MVFIILRLAEINVLVFRLRKDIEDTSSDLETIDK